MQDFIERAANILRTARHAVALTGAGLSTPSGIPDFRSAQTGLWETANPMEVATIYAFRENPARFFNWIRPLAASMRDDGRTPRTSRWRSSNAPASFTW